jgi:hypothetical protein
MIQMGCWEVPSNPAVRRVQISIRLTDCKKTKDSKSKIAKRHKSKQKALANGKYLKAEVCSRLRVVILDMILGRFQTNVRQ